MFKLDNKDTAHETTLSENAPPCKKEWNMKDGAPFQCLHTLPEASLSSTS